MAANALAWVIAAGRARGTARFAAEFGVDVLFSSLVYWKGSPRDEPTDCGGGNLLLERGGERGGKRLFSVFRRLRTEVSSSGVGGRVGTGGALAGVILGATWSIASTVRVEYILVMLWYEARGVLCVEKRGWCEAPMVTEALWLAV